MRCIQSNRPISPSLLAIALASAGALRPAPALAFSCYVGDAPAGYVNLHQRPDERSKVVARLSSSMMVGDGRRIRERNGWIHVRWSKVQMSQANFERGKGDGTGWIRREDIRGECED